MDRLRIPLTKENLARVLPWLEKDFPNSLPVYHMARNIVENRFAYPEMKFIVDKLPVPSVCLCKPMRSKTTSRSIFNDHLLVYVHAHSVKAFQKMLRCQPDLFHWSKDMTFIDIHPAMAQVFMSMEGGGFSPVTPEEGCPSGERVFSFDLTGGKISRLPMPSDLDLRLGTLSATHVGQIAKECRFTAPSWKKLFRFMLSHGFPSVALYDDNVALDTPIAYCMYMMQGLRRGRLCPAGVSPSRFIWSGYQGIVDSIADTQSALSVDANDESSLRTTVGGLSRFGRCGIQAP
ncbi:uncharacterized protein LOC129599805 [Paramacrobiotus metropolitanus]|uniref:uncharacterized protein LOC129599805 n=1 Tax=Paramacrobiotus metropolitanus TaxID=2943436 RepID=UPI002445F0BE|nr:uncharacterized protein LOC129599805 [Paramacrobiotus metropolitanus]